MAKTPAQKAKRRAKRAAARAALKNNTSSGRAKAQPKRKSKKKKKQKRRTARGSVNAAEGRMNSAYRNARFAGMSRVTDGISIMKTVHNSTHIEDTFRTRREKVSNIIGSTGTTLTNSVALYLNPGNSVLFPIFSQIANTYEQYRVNDIVLSYETEAYAASGSAVSAGKVLLATNYNPTQALFTFDYQMENFSNSDRGAPFCEIVHDVLLGDHALRDEPLKTYYVNYSANTAAPASESAKFFDIGLFQLSTQGCVDDTSEIGELYVTYSFTMIRPCQPTTLTSSILSAHIVEGANGTGTAVAPLGTTGGRLRTGSNIPCVMTTNTFTLPLTGTWLVCAQWYCANNVAAPIFSLGSNIVVYGSNIFNDDTTFKFNTAAASSSAINGIYTVSANGVGANNTVTISGNTSMTGGSCDIFVTAFNTNIITGPDPRFVPPPSIQEQAYMSRIDRLEAMVSRLLSHEEKEEAWFDSDDEPNRKRKVPMVALKR